MIEGTYYKEWSPTLGRDMEFKVFGHSGCPVLALPGRGGRFYDWEDQGLWRPALPCCMQARCSCSVRMAWTARVCWMQTCLCAAGLRCRRNISAT